jgi:hypothetical protein
VAPSRIGKSGAPWEIKRVGNGFISIDSTLLAVLTNIFN